MTGKVKFFDNKKGWGYIVPEGGNSKDVFVHFSAINGRPGHKSLNQGDNVSFEVEESQRGLQAINVSLI
jgi:CspA family cold shock protein